MAGFRKGAYVHVYLDMRKLDPADWYFMPSGVFATEKSIAPTQISFISVGPDEGREVLLWLGELMGVAPEDLTLRGADEWEFCFASDDRASDNVTPWAPPMDEVLEGVMWFRCPDASCGRCVPCVFLMCPFCGVSFSYSKAKAPPYVGSDWSKICSCPIVARARDLGTRWMCANDDRFIQSASAKGTGRGLEELRRRVTEYEGIGRRRYGFDGYMVRGAHGIQDAMPQGADSLLQSSQVGPGPAKAPAPAPPAPHIIVAQPSGPGPQSVPQTPLQPAPTKGNTGNRAGTRCQRSSAETPRRAAVLAQPGAPPGEFRAADESDLLVEVL